MTGPRKPCAQCGVAFERRRNEAYQQFEERRFCCRACVGVAQRKARVSNDQFRGRYRTVKVAGRRIREHRLVMEGVLGRRLLPTEHVHHIDGDGLNNDPANLEVLTLEEHSRRHGGYRHPVTKDCVVCGSSFTPHITKRARQQTCGPECKGRLLSILSAKRKAAK